LLIALLRETSSASGGDPVYRRFEHPRHHVLEPGIAVEGLDGVEDQVGPDLVEAAHEVLQVVLDAEEGHLMSAFPERIGYLILHLGLVVGPRRNLGGHLALVLRVVPPAVRGVKCHDDAHFTDARLRRPEKWPDRVWGATPLVARAGGLHYPIARHPPDKPDARKRHRRRWRWEWSSLPGKPG
jgi:hypothetical protein